MEIEFEGLHVFILAITALAILFADHEGFAYMRGKKETLSLPRVVLLHRLVWVGLLGMLITGAIMVWPARSYYFSDAAFLVKMAFVCVLVLNSFFIHTVMHVATSTPFAELNKKERTKLLVSGAASAVGWVGAATMGFFFI